MRIGKGEEDDLEDEGGDARLDGRAMRESVLARVVVLRRSSMVEEFGGRNERKVSASLRSTGEHNTTIELVMRDANKHWPVCACVCVLHDD